MQRERDQRRRLAARRRHLLRLRQAVLRPCARQRGRAGDLRSRRSGVGGGSARCRPAGPRSRRTRPYAARRRTPIGGGPPAPPPAGALFSRGPTTAPPPPPAGAAPPPPP